MFYILKYRIEKYHILYANKIASYILQIYYAIIMISINCLHSKILSVETYPLHEKAK